MAYGAKLHLLTETIPISFLIEKASGKATDGTNNILDIVIDGYMQMTSFIGGSSEEVDFVMTTLQ